MLERRLRIVGAVALVAIAFGGVSLAWAQPWRAAPDRLTVHAITVRDDTGEVLLTPTHFAMSSTSAHGGNATLDVQDGLTLLGLGNGSDDGVTVKVAPGDSSLDIGAPGPHSMIGIDASAQDAAIRWYANGAPAMSIGTSAPPPWQQR